MLLTSLPFDYATLVAIGDRRRKTSAFTSGTRVRRDAGRGKIR
jgi:hypothetical protein